MFSPAEVGCRECRRHYELALAEAQNEARHTEARANMEARLADLEASRAAIGQDGTAAALAALDGAIRRIRAMLSMPPEFAGALTAAELKLLPPGVASDPEALLRELENPKSALRQMHESVLQARGGRPVSEDRDSRAP